MYDMGHLFDELEEYLPAPKKDNEFTIKEVQERDGEKRTWRQLEHAFSQMVTDGKLGTRIATRHGDGKRIRVWWFLDESM